MEALEKYLYYRRKWQKWLYRNKRIATYYYKKMQAA